MVRWRWPGRDGDPDPTSVPRSRRRAPRGESASGPETAPAAQDGPYALADLPSQAVRRFDLGALLVPVLPGVGYRFEVSGRRRPASGSAGRW